jgi:hypothetical protein
VPGNTRDVPDVQKGSFFEMTRSKVAAIYCLLAEDASPVGEGLFMSAGLGVPTPVICTDLDQPDSKLASRLEHLRRFAREVVARHGHRLRLVRFIVREDLDVF